MLTKTTLTIWYDDYSGDVNEAIDSIVDMVTGTDGVEYVETLATTASTGTYDHERGTWVIPAAELGGPTDPTQTGPSLNGQGSAAPQNYVIVRGGLVENDPNLPVLDLDILDDQVIDTFTIAEVTYLRKMALKVDLPDVVAEFDQWLAKHASPTLPPTEGRNTDA
ncbi:MAG: hypothetical protein ACOH1Y_11460 [Propionicimonas sp.]